MNTIKVRDIEIGAGAPKIIVPIVGVTKKDIIEEAKTFDSIPVDVVEWRVDWFEHVFEFDKAMFDSRVFNIPKEEVNNCLLWRQQDATRNSIQSVAQANFSHKQLEGKNCNELQEMLWQEKGINWNDYPTHLKRGSCCVKSTYTLEVDGKDVQRSEWVIDNEIPIFSQNTWYVNGRITFDE